MAKKDQSVAPKERVNITYKAKVGDKSSKSLYCGEKIRVQDNLD